MIIHLIWIRDAPIPVLAYPDFLSLLYYNKRHAHTYNLFNSQFYNKQS